MYKLSTRCWTCIAWIVCAGLAHAAEPSRPMVVAHRGLLLDAPENTLQNIRACLELQLGFEFDVQRTKDGRLVCLHDATVDRTTNGTGKVAELTLAEIQKLDAGSWFDLRFAGAQAPSVEEVLELVAKYQHQKFLIAVDLKAANVEQEVVRLAETHDVLDRLLFIGRAISEPSVRRALRAANGKAHVAAVANTPDGFHRALTDADADWTYLRYVPSREEMDAVRQAGKKAFIAGPAVGSRMEENWRRSAELEIDGILTDYSLELQRMLRSADTKGNRRY